MACGGQPTLSPAGKIDSPPREGTKIFNNKPDRIEERARFTYEEAMNRGFTHDQAKALIAQLDHESAGTWDEDVIGDHGCAVGIIQWNHCVNSRKAPSAWQDQIHLYLDMTLERYQETRNFELAQVMWNRPKIRYEGNYKNWYWKRLQNSLVVLNPNF